MFITRLLFVVVCYVLLVHDRKEFLTAPPTQGDKKHVLDSIKATLKKLTALGATVTLTLNPAAPLERLKKIDARLKSRLERQNRTNRTNTTNTNENDKKRCRKMAAKKLWGQYNWTKRILHSGKWKCPSGWQGTGCTWKMGTEFEQKQCRRKKSGTERPTERGAGRTVATNKIIASIKVTREKIIALGGTPRGSDRFLSGNLNSTKLLATLVTLQEQLKELRKSNPPEPSKDPGQNGRAVTGALTERAEQAEQEKQAKQNIYANIQTTYKRIKELGGTPLESASAFSINPNTNPRVTLDELKTVEKVLSTQLLNLNLARNTAAPVAPAQTDTRGELEKLVTYGAMGCSLISDHEMSGKIVDMFNHALPEAFVIVTWKGQGGNAVGHKHKHHIECQRSGLLEGTRGYDIYIWPSGASGQFSHRNGPGYINWAMGGGKFRESWRSGTDGSFVTIQN
jgi:hypothetical protein